MDSGLLLFGCRGACTCRVLLFGDDRRNRFPCLRGAVGPHGLSGQEGLPVPIEVLHELSYNGSIRSVRLPEYAVSFHTAGAGTPAVRRLICTTEEENRMEMIQSFSIDHMRIVPGIFTSRVDRLGDFSVTTYDVRLKRPNREPVIDPAAMHSLEHIIATYLRNDPVWKDDVIYWGPMGCLTGFYLILKGSRAPRDLYALLLDAFRFAGNAQEVPGTAPQNCGYYRMHNLDMAKWHANEFAAYLEANAENSGIFEYPRTERLTTDDGRDFYDS